MTDITNNETREQLTKYVDSIEGYEAEKLELSERLKEVLDEAKNAGFDIKTIKTLLKIRKTPKDKFEEEQYLLNTYGEALQMDFFINNK
jgi:uncharacterized protein (UPF0335 family)